MLIAFVGGGTLGSVVPLLAVREALADHPDAEFAWLGTAKGPERALVTDAGMAFTTIVAGKWRRYFSWANFVAPLLTLWGAWQAWRWLRRRRPDVVVGAASFVQVPAAWAAHRLGIPVLLHQPDAAVGLATRMVRRYAAQVTTAFAATAAQLGEGAVAIGHPVPLNLRAGDAARGAVRFGLEAGVPTVLVLGGSLGAQRLNDAIVAGLPRLVAGAQVIHQTGMGKMPAGVTHPRWHPVEFFREELADAYAAADVVVTRGGMGALSEVASLGKPAVVVPLPNSPQEANAAEFARLNAALVLTQPSPDELVGAIRSLLGDAGLRASLARNVRTVLATDAAQRLATVILRIGDYHGV